MSPLRIMHSEAATSFGGQEQYIYRMMRAMRDRGHHLEAICQPHAVLAQRLRDDGFTVHTLYMDGPINYVKGVLQLRKILRDGRFDVLNSHSRRDTMLAALEEYFPDNVSWTHPQGGLFLWVTLPGGIDAAQLLRDALEYRIAFVPGAAFHANGGGSNTMRLSFSNVNSEQIEEGIRRLGRLLHTHMLRA